MHIYQICIEKVVQYTGAGKLTDSLVIEIKSGNKQVFKTRRKAFGFICRKLKQIQTQIEFNELLIG